MKIKLNFKTPDIVFEMIEDLREEFSDKNNPSYIENEDELTDKLLEIESVMEKFIKYGENIEIEICIETQTARVLTTKRI